MRSLSRPFIPVLVLMVLAGRASWAAPGAIHLSVSNSSVPAFDSFTVTVGLDGYTNPTEADGYNFRVLYDPARFAVVTSSATLHDASGPTQNWLRYPAQESVAGLVLDNFTIFDPGVIHVSVADMRLPPDPLNPRGTAAAAGFLYGITFTALTPGVGAITVVPAVGGGVLHDAFLNPAGVPDLAGAAANITVSGVRLRIQRTGTNQVTITWPKGALETTDRLGAAWAPLPTATNSLTVPSVGGTRFYRAVLP
jgi:hypothetical protein